MQGINTTRLGDIYVRREADIVKVRERVRRLAREMGFDQTTQIKITTAISELTRNIYEYAKSGAITLAVAQAGRAPRGPLPARGSGPRRRPRPPPQVQPRGFRPPPRPPP